MLMNFIMSEAAVGTSSAAPRRSTIQLNVISPSIQVQKITFSELPIAITVADLKSKISDAAPNKVEPSQQKLIYRGRVLNNGQKTLAEIFEHEVDKIQHTIASCVLRLIVQSLIPVTVL